MKVAIGLRNPGPDYAGTRHNIGLEVIERLLVRHGERLKRGPLRVRAEVGEIRLGGDRMVVAAPLSFMNEAGGPVRSVLNHYKVDPVETIIVHDDIDLAFGRLRLQIGGGTGGHNGLKSVEKALGTRDFVRLKIGVGRPPQHVDAADHVLARFSKTERAQLDLLVEDAGDIIELWVSDPARAQEQAARRLPE